MEKITMDQGTMLGLLGLLATVIFGVFSVYLVIKRKYPGQITLVVEDCIGLFESIVKHFPDLSVTYINRPVGEGIVLLKGALVNTGSKDISQPMIEEQLSLVLPEGFKWLQTNIVAKSTSVQVNIATSDLRLRFETGLFRCNEFIRFESLAEVPMPSADKSPSIEKELLDNLGVYHRIADTQKVSTILLPSLAYAGRRFKFRLVPFLLAVLLMGIVLSAIFIIKGPRGELHFIVPSEGERIEVHVKPKTDGQLVLSGVTKKDFNKTMPAEEFFRIPNVAPKVVPEARFRIITGITALFYIAVPLALLAYIFRGRRRLRRLRALLAIPNE